MKHSLIEATLLAFVEQNTLTPTELDAKVGLGKYVSKHVSWLRHWGHEIRTNKDGRNVVSYTYISESPTAYLKLADIRAKDVRKAAKVAPAAQVKAQAVAKVKAKPAQRKQIAKAAARKARVHDEVEETFGTSGNVGSYSVDPDWDSVDDVSDLL